MDANELLSLLQNPIVVLDADGNIEQLNDRAMMAFGQPPEGKLDLATLLDCLQDSDGHPLTVNRLNRTTQPLSVRLPHPVNISQDAQLHLHRLKDGRRCLEFVPSENGSASQLDALTGLIDRNRMLQLIDRQMAAVGSGAIILMDIDRLKIINDFLGYAVGDRVIQALGKAFRAQTPKEIHVARWSGHEFLALVPPSHCVQLEQISNDFLSIAKRLPLLDEVSLPGGVVTLSIGHTRFGPLCHDRSLAEDSAWARIGVGKHQDGRSMYGDPLGRVNAAVFEAKRHGRNRVVDADRLTRPSVFITGGALETALDEERIVAAVQPIVELKTGNIIADESLARLITPDGTVVPAGEFINAASALQIAHRIDHSIILQTISYCVSSHFDVPRAHFVNISGDFLRHPNLVEDTIQAAMNACSCTHPDLAGQTQVKPLVIEVTERELLEDTQDALNALSPLIDFGLRLAIDDFGSGYSSYRYLLDLPIHFLKIEGDLIRRITENSKAKRIVHNIQDMATDLGLTTVAEFVGDADTASMLTDIGIDWAQGFYYGRPELLHRELADQLRKQAQVQAVKS